MTDDLAPAGSPPEEPSTPSAATPEGSQGGGVATSSDGAPSSAPRRRRRRRGGRGRGGSSRPRPQGEGEASEPAEAPEGGASQPRDEQGAEEGAPKRSGSGEQRRRSPAKPKPEQAAEADASSAPETPEEQSGSKSQETGEEAPKRRRRRGGRGRGGKAKADGGSESAEDEPADKPKGSQPKRGARGGRAKKEPDAKQGDAKKEAGKAKKSEEPKEPVASTRLSAKSQRGARARTARGRRREALPLVRRVQDKVMVITEHGERDQIAVVEDRDLVQHYITRVGAHSMVGNIYMARVQNVLPGMEAAFLDIGRGRNAVLYAGEVNYEEEVEGQPQRIEHALKSGQAVMVQVTKDPIGGKGARLTAQVSLPGRYLVLVPDSQVFGISRRLPDEERKRLRTAVKKVRPDDHGIIVRTAAEGASEEALAADVERLAAEWEAIAKKAKKAKAPSVLYEEPELTVRVVRDLFNDEEFKEMVTDSPRIHEIVTGYLRDVAPDLLPKVRLYDGSLSAFEEFHIVEQIHKALDRKVWLPSGGYLVIDRTEALTVIDVNTGKHVGKNNLEETVVKTNLEAAEEVARQLRLRDIGGMIIVDFIDMLLEQNKKKLIATLKETLAKDKTRTQVFDISPLGLLELTRKRVSAGLLESFSETCPTCEGRGILLTLEV